MIFASVGSMLPFDRLTQAVDEWAFANPATPVFIQIGDGAYEPRHAEWARIVAHKDYQQRLADCTLFVAHVGMGSILQALEISKQMLLMPRHASLREHTTEHQLHTADKFRDTPGIVIVDDVDTLKARISELAAAPMAGGSVAPRAPIAFSDRVRAFLATGASKGH
jgi:UDP-N-acetylglucosamine transferase subunit ALG13